MKTASSELFELCKQVFEKTGWGSTDLDKQIIVTGKQIGRAHV